jgi:hypothetical protein
MSLRAPELSRRAVRSGLAAATASGLGHSALASAPMANVQVPAVYRFKLGGFECTVVSDGPLRLGPFSPEAFRCRPAPRIDPASASSRPL